MLDDAIRCWKYKKNLKGQNKYERSDLKEYMNFASESSERQIFKRFPGVSCAYRDAAGREFLKYDGAADKEKSIPVDGGTVFPACSISKFVTALFVCGAGSYR
ncbi:MAG: beta-lactamase family protein [Lachnospiraceae bacterium]|nr:beta-lactamase family protein [Lachnospiraceae bacterium]